MTVLYGLFAKTAKGRQRFQGELKALLPPGFPQNREAWWADTDEGVALHSPRTLNDASGTVGFALALSDISSQASNPAEPRYPNAATLEDVCQRGLDAIGELRGEFVFAHWDGPRRTLALARDPVGQRNMFIRDDGDIVLVCSEFAPLIEDPGFDRRLDAESAFNFLCFGMPPTGRTLAARITCVPAAHALLWSPGRPLFLQRYYSPIGFDDRKVADAAWRQRIVDTLDDAIGSCDGGGQGALLLSGGVDSSYIAMTCAARRGAEGYEAYTVEFEDADIESEAEYAALVARTAGIRHRVVPMSISDAGRSLDAVLALPQPCSAWAAATHHHLAAHIGADGHRQLLSGLGADEVFGGYSQYLRSYRTLRRQADAWPQACAIDAFDGLLLQPAQARDKLFHGVPRFFDRVAQVEGMHRPFDRFDHASRSVEFYRECRRMKPDAHLFELMVAHECQHRIPDLLLAGFEQITRGVGVAVRYPFLDPRVVSIACALGASERFWLSGRRWQNKKLLRRIALDRLPVEIITRKPVSYNAPIKRWLSDPSIGRKLIRATRESGFWELGIVKREWLERLLATAPESTAQAKPGFHSEQLWILIVICAWYDRWISTGHRISATTP